MTDYTLKMAEVRLSTGVTIVAEVASLEAIKQLVKDVEASRIGQLAHEPAEPRRAPATSTQSATEDPLGRMEVRAGLKLGSLGKAKVLAIKEGVPQLLHPSKFKITDALLVLMFAVETGLSHNPTAYDTFSAIYEAQNLKSGSPLSMLITNLRNQGYLDKRAYADGRSLRLTGKGEQKAFEVLRQLADVA